MDHRPHLQHGYRAKDPEYGDARERFVSPIDPFLGTERRTRRDLLLHREAVGATGPGQAGADRKSARPPGGFDPIDAAGKAVGRIVRLEVHALPLPGRAHL